MEEFSKIRSALLLADDRDQETIDRDILDHQYRMDLARDAGRMRDEVVQNDPNARGTKDKSILPFYSLTPTGFKRGTLDQPLRASLRP